MTAQTAKSKADKCITLSEVPTGTMLYNIAKAMINAHGFYGYTNASTDEKVFVAK